MTLFFLCVSRVEYALDGERRGRALLSSAGLGVVLVDILLNRCRLEVRQKLAGRVLLRFVPVVDKFDGVKTSLAAALVFASGLTRIQNGHPSGARLLFYTDASVEHSLD